MEALWSGVSFGLLSVGQLTSSIDVMYIYRLSVMEFGWKLSHTEQTYFPQMLNSTTGDVIPSTLFNF